MRNLKRIVAVLLVIASVFAFAGCNKKTTGQNGDVKEYSIFLFNAKNPYNAEMPVWKRAEEKTGVRLKNTVADYASSEQVAYSTMLASGKMPDIIVSSASNLRELGTVGGLIPLNDLIEKYAPSIKAFFEEYPDAANYCSNGDGNIYFIPNSITDMKKGFSNVYMVRQDWLDKLGLKIPTTIEEYHDMLVAFKTQDPNGNGLADEVPYFARGKSLDGIIAMYGVACFSSYDGIDKNGEYYFSPITEEYKQAMKTAAQWRKEGLIDEEIFTRNNAREQFLGQDIGGATYDWVLSTTTFNDTFKDTVPGLNIVPILPVKNQKGEIYSVGSTSPYNNRGWGITSAVSEEDRIEIIKYMDYFMSDEGRDLMSYGIEGLSYTKDKDGKVVWSETAMSYETGALDYLGSIGALSFIGTIRREGTDTSLYSETALKAVDMYSQEILATPWETPIYTTEEQKRLAAIEENIDTEFREQQQKWFYGKEDVDATWDAYIKRLKGMGLDEYMNIQKSAYERMKK